MATAANITRGEIPNNIMITRLILCSLLTLATLVTLPGWSLTYDEPLPNGYFDWIVESYAPSGDIVSNYGGVTIDTEAPEITVDNFLKMDEHGNIKVSGSSSEMATMKITINGQVMILTAAGGDWVSKDVSGLKVGYSYPMTITSNDVAGNFSQTNVYRTVVK